jgi:predicted transcriptional regulator
MALPKKIPVEQMVKLADQLSPKEHAEFLRKIKLQELKREIQIGIDQANRGELFSEEEVFARLKTCHDKALAKKG